MAPTTAATTSLPTLTQSGARVALQAAEQYALEIGVPMSIAIVDAHTHLISFTRMDGAKITSINSAMDMAFTAAGNRIPTSAYQENSRAGSATSGIGNSISGRFCTLGGGVPILSPSSNGEILGAIGCSIGTSHQDEAAAKAGRDAVLALIQKEKQDEQRRVESERQAVLNLWKEKEEEVGSLREELERGSKRMRFDETGVRKGSICLSTSGSLSGRTPDTPPEDGEIHPSFVGVVALGRV
ncbi:DUF336-domain-containing protein [Setomelanomma holmii]|uniref:DUF336-domain-containing protein n=1 Tax=Setomelanomma holmii TaxID=210430 RepID=A0A9P4HEH3_9PLEO|nr:DUF336-domain-containing protein [Setomelanomma holmii]